MTKKIQIETLLMSPWWMRIPTRDFTDVTLMSEDTDEDDEDHLWRGQSQP